MGIKERIESVLGVRIHDEQVDFIKTYYGQFYNNPEEFRGDGLVSVILEDLGIQVKNDPISAASMVDGINLKHCDAYATLAWGFYKEHPIYAVAVEGFEVQALKELSTDMELNRVDSSSSVPVATVAISDDDKSAIVFVQALCDIKAIGELPFTICKIPGYSKGCMSRLFINGKRTFLETFYVPFVNVGSGRNPVLWRIHKSVSGAECVDNELLDELFKKINLADGVYEEDFRSVRLNLEYKYPGIDLETQEEKRYVVLKGAKGQLIFNQNAIPGKSNIHTQEMLVPWAVDIYDGCDGAETNLHSIINGTLEWSDLYFRIPAAGAVARSNDNTEESEQASTVVRNRPEVGLVNASDGRGEGTRKTPLGKMLDNATSDYKQS